MENTLFDYIFCAVGLCCILFIWGKFKRSLANGRFYKAREFLAAQDYKSAILIYQEIGSELKSEPDYWYSLAVALAGAGGVEDALASLKKLLHLDPFHENGIKLMETLSKVV
ncbi:MAG: tetratricopeptide repeat protein [Synergistaceae bacterium]|jgi:tetratricopeptide (TPR) repeat protein|nr:tetratricopeptide repeat protein [Synergistaceae bacterium]